MKRGYSRAFTPADRATERRYLLDHIPATLWIQVRAKAKREGLSMRALILQLLTTWLKTDTTNTDQEQWDEERRRVAALPRNVPLCSMCSEHAVAEVGDICDDCKQTWSGRR